ncbi:hypothetical protein [Caballeronia sp. LjRoot31]|uniref:hypothetical protein n=1 Tax=Caballeronia sp. LjRoot31 TaxID=3342324 RepID=UPI003ECCA4AA
MTTLADIKRGIADVEAEIAWNNAKEYANAEEKQAFKAIQFRADQVFQEFGRTAAMHVEPRGGETALQYRVRIAQTLAGETKKYRHTEISPTIDPASLAEVEARIYADAARQAKHPLDLKPGEFREIKKTVGTRQYSEFVTGEGPGAFKTLYADCIAPTQLGVLMVDGKPTAIPNMG